MSAIPASRPAQELDPLDLYSVRSMLSEEERLVQDSVAKFVDEKVVPIIGECFEHERFPRELVSGVAELGLLGSSIQGYGCAGLNSVSYGLICQELERGDSGLRSFVSVQSSLCMHPIYAFGSEEQKQRWLPGMAKGELIGCFGLSEPDHGSDPGGMETKATPDGKGGWVLNGTKRWITNGSIADVAVVWAKLREDEADPRTEVIRGFLVEKERPGFSRPLMHGKWSLRASITSELILEDCWIPEENLLPESRGLKSPLMCLTQARYGIAWGAVGAAIACYECALDYAKSRVVFSRPIGGYQLVQAKLVDMLTEITKAQLLCWRLGRLKEAGEMRHEQVSLAKMNNVSQALRIARLARDILGANGITDDYPVIRHMLNLETVNTYEGTEDVHRLTLGRDITGLSAFD